MAVPDFQTIMRPVLTVDEDGDRHDLALVRGTLADPFQLSEEDRAQRLPSGTQRAFDNRVGWAATYLVRAGCLERPRRAVTR
jgi:restriction system protein